MKHAYALAMALFAVPVFAAETAPLPPDVTSYLQRNSQAAACQPKHAPGLSLEEIVDNFILARQSPECAALERERLALMERYKDNAEIVNALTLKVGFTAEPGPI